MANLRILYDNAAESAAISTSSYVGNLIPDNLKSNKKSKVWRGAIAPSNSINLSWLNSVFVNGIVLPFTNLTSTSTIKVTLFNSVGAEIYDSGDLLAIRGKSLGNLNWGSDVLGVNSYSYVKCNYIVMWLPKIFSVKSMVIKLTDPNNPSGYIEASKLIVGKYWSPRFNTGFGMALTPENSSTHERADSGDLIVTRGVKNRKLAFELNWMDSNDRDRFNDISNGNSITTPIFVSLFPEDVDPFKEQIYQIFGNLTQDISLTHSMHTMYSGRVEITEI